MSFAGKLDVDSEAACQIFRSETLQIKRYCQETHTYIGPIISSPSGPLKWSVINENADFRQTRLQTANC